MKRCCAYCHRRIWPWQRRGWYTLWRDPDTMHGEAVWWHSRCFHEAGHYPVGVPR